MSRALTPSGTPTLFAGVGIAIYIVGIPLAIFAVLRRNRDYLYESTCPKHQIYKHVRIERMLGTVYNDYTEANYYFDMIDLGRRLLLTEG